MNTISAFFFDLDGTLVNTHQSNYQAYLSAVRDVTGIDLGTELLDRVKAGESSDHFLSEMMPDVSPEVIAKINTRKKEVYPDHLDVSVLNEFLSTFLEQMAIHYTTVLVTTAKKQNASAVLKQYDLERHFTHSIFGDQVTNMKPHPEAYLLALEKAGVKADQALAFEDSEKGIQAAHAAGIKTIHIRSFE